MENILVLKADARGWALGKSGAGGGEGGEGGTGTGGELSGLGEGWRGNIVVTGGWLDEGL